MSGNIPSRSQYEIIFVAVVNYVSFILYSEHIYSTFEDLLRLSAWDSKVTLCRGFAFLSIRLMSLHLCFMYQK